MLTLWAAEGLRDSRRFGSVEHRARSTERQGDVVAEVPDRPEVRAVHGTGKDAAALSVALSVAVPAARVASDVLRGGHRRERWTISFHTRRGCATFPMIPE